MRKFGLIGKSLEHSFSRDYFISIFEKEGITDAKYNLYEISNISDINKLIVSNPEILGFNVTIPYKEEIIPYLHFSDEIVKETGACNCVKVIEGKLYGYNTDVYGFLQSLSPLLKPQYYKAVILGNGGAAKSVAFVLQQLSIDFVVVARNPKTSKELNWEPLTPSLIRNANIIINTTPLGMFPNLEDFPNLPYQALSSSHLVYDLIYNPQKTLFLDKAHLQGAIIKNGMQMLHLQAKQSWKIWNNKL